ncbi:MAG: hypothetical protein LBE62_02280 [Azonexus sp.]|nr:hypothetical protein [Azonexus sp.]
MPDTTEIILQRPHRHAGRNYPVGARLTLRADKAQWLIAKGVAVQKTEGESGGSNQPDGQQTTSQSSVISPQSSAKKGAK